MQKHIKLANWSDNPLTHPSNVQRKKYIILDEIKWQEQLLPDGNRINATENRNEHYIVVAQTYINYIKGESF